MNNTVQAVQERGFIEGPRWSGLTTALKNAAFVSDVVLDIDEDKHWFSTTVRFTVTGTQAAVNKFGRVMRAAVEEYNGPEENPEARS